jgi:hypothetical protein
MAYLEIAAMVDLHKNSGLKRPVFVGQSEV